MSASRIASAAIKIPKRIERKPTDILKALASTVKYVPSEPDQLLQDDPYLLPIRPRDRNFYSLSKLSGKSTAKYLLNKHPEIFFRDDAEPKVRSFLPPEEYRADMVFDEGDIRWCIDNNDPINAIVAYETLSKADVKLSNEVLLDFFEMLCYTNEQKLVDLLESQRDYFSTKADRNLVKQTWNTTGLASKIFNQIKEDSDSSRVYSAMIAGLSKYGEHAGAKQVFEDFKEFHPEEALYTRAYDSLLSSIPNLNSSIETAIEAVENIVKHMEQHLVKPDLRVFNSILRVYKGFNTDDKLVRESMQLINDMRCLNIEPSLFTYGAMIHIMCRNRSRGQYINTICEILDYIFNNDEVLKVKDDRDDEFLITVIRLSTVYLNNSTIVSKLHKLFMKKPTFFATFGTRQIYLDMYFKYIVTTGRLDDIWNFYTAYVPMVFRPSAESYDALTDALDLFQADESIITRVGLDLVEFKMFDKIKDDSMYRKLPAYIEKLSQSTMDRKQRDARQQELSEMAKV